MKLFDAMLARIAPYECLGCGGEGSLLCGDCFPKLGSPVPSRCFRCQRATEDFQVCPSCRPSAGLSRVRAGYVYRGYAKALVKEFKFGGKRGAAKEIAALMARLVPQREAVLVPVPTATQRARSRGYDHAKLLASALADATTLPWAPLLARTSQHRQLGAGRNERLRSMAGAFRAIRSLEGAHIVLVDDVVTTGATLAEAAKTLRAAGARRVDAVVFAQTVL
jgi:ComF family protein